MVNSGPNPGNYKEIERLRERLAEAEDTLNAIRRGEVDAVVVSTARGEQIFTLKNAEHPYRVMVEQMNEGAFTISIEGTILYSNPSFARMLKVSPDKLLLTSIYDYIAPESRAHFQALLKQNEIGQITFSARDKSRLNTHMAIRILTMDSIDVYCAVVTDLTERQHMKFERQDQDRKLREVPEKAPRDNEKGQEAPEATQPEEDLRRRLEEAEQTLNAIRSGGVDALVINTDKGDQVFTFNSPERQYRIIVEQMNAGALTLSAEGHILYCNQRFAQMVGWPLQQILGNSIYNYLAPKSRAEYRRLVENDARGKISLVARDKTRVPVYFALNTLTLEENAVVHAAIVTDLTKEKEEVTHE
jgi:PAS domain S-box-containing protein